MNNAVVKRLFFSSLIFVFLSFCLVAQEAAQEAAQETDDKFEQFAELKIIQYCKSPISAERYGVVGTYGIGQEDWTARAGFSFAKKDGVLNLSGIWHPLRAGNWNFGIELIYNLDFYWSYALCITNNILPGFYFDWNPASWYRMTLHADYFLKLRSLFALEGTPCLWNSSFAFSWKNSFFPAKDFCIYLEFSSIDDFSYKILFSPIFVLGFDYTIKEVWSLCVEVLTEYQDFFTLSAQYFDTLINISVRYKW